VLELWSSLAPLAAVSAALPLQAIVTLGLVRTSMRSAAAWVAGMTVVRLIQGVVFGVVLAESEANSAADAPQVFFGTVLLVLAILLYVKALRTAVGAEDEDAPPPQWLTKVSSMSPPTAFAAGAGFITISAKFLVFTLGAIGAIGEAHLGARLSVLVYLLFVALVQVAPFTILALAASPSPRSAESLVQFNNWLRRNNRAITILFALIFGTWILLKALGQLHVIGV
jgi:hypothetical protein